MARSFVSGQAVPDASRAARRIATFVVAVALLGLLATMLTRMQSVPPGGPLLTEDLSWLVFSIG